MSIATMHALAIVGVAIGTGFILGWGSAVGVESRPQVPVPFAHRSVIDPEPGARPNLSEAPHGYHAAALEGPTIGGEPAVGGRSVRATGRIVPAPGPEARLWLDSAVGRQQADMADGRFTIEGAPEGSAVLRLDASDLRLGVDGYVVELSRYRTDLGTIMATSLHELVVECDPDVAGPLYLRRERRLRSALPSEFFSWPVDEGRNLGSRRWQFERLDTEWHAGELWTAAGWEGRLEPTRYGVARVRMQPPVDLRVGLRIADGQQPLSGLVEGWRLVACPSWAGRPGPWTGLALSDKPWICWRLVQVSPGGIATIRGLRGGSWYISLLAEHGVVLAELALDVPAVREGRPAFKELAWPVVAPARVSLLPPRCADATSICDFETRYADGARVLRIRIVDGNLDVRRGLLLPPGRATIRVKASACDDVVVAGGLSPIQSSVFRTSLDVVPGARHELCFPCAVCARLTGIAGQGWQIERGAAQLVTASPSHFTAPTSGKGGNHD